MRGSLIGALVAWVLCTTAGTVSAQERYYLILFGSDRGPLEPCYSHSFAIFVRAVRRHDPPTWHLEQHVISWMPATLKLRLGAHLPELGTNLPYHSSLLWALATKQRISMWGPCEINPDLYWRARQQVARLESGQVLYKAIDRGSPGDAVSNCIHALDGLTGERRLNALLFTWGENASARILERYQPWLIHPEVTHDWLLPQLRLQGYPVVRRSSVSPHLQLPHLRANVPAGPWVGYSQLSPARK